MIVSGIHIAPQCRQTFRRLAQKRMQPRMKARHHPCHHPCHHFGYHSGLPAAHAAHHDQHRPLHPRASPYITQRMLARTAQTLLCHPATRTRHKAHRARTHRLMRTADAGYGCPARSLRVYASWAAAVDTCVRSVCAMPLLPEQPHALLMRRACATTAQPLPLPLLLRSYRTPPRSRRQAA